MTRGRGVSLLLRTTLVLAGLIWSSSPGDTQVNGQDIARDLDSLLSKKQYPQLEQLLSAHSQELSAENRAYFEGVMSNRLNRVEHSIELLQPLIPRLLVSNFARGETALCTVADDYVKKFRYADAVRIYAEADRVARRENAESSCAAGREASRWTLLSDASPQTVTNNGEFTIQGKWDSIGLLQLPITLGSYSGSWIFDTGANVSVISQSVADRLGIQISSASASSEGSSGRSLRVRTAVIPELHLGTAVIHNVAVLVAADADLKFSSIDYQIEGSLGLPVLAALGTITVSRDGEIRFAQAAEAGNATGSHNMFFEKLTPLIAADFGQGEQLFTIDTGAIGTVLSSQFYQGDKAAFDSRDLVQLEMLGAGGSWNTTAYQLRDLAASLGGGCTKLAAVQLLTQPLGLADEFYGNVGQDALRPFTSFTFDFHSMRFRVNGSATGPCTARIGG